MAKMSDDSAGAGNPPAVLIDGRDQVLQLIVRGALESSQISAPSRLFRSLQRHGIDLQAVWPVHLQLDLACVQQEGGSVLIALTMLWALAQRA